PARTAWTVSSTRACGNPSDLIHEPSHGDTGPAQARLLVVLDPGRAGAGRRAGPARSVAGGRAALRPGGQADGGERQLAVPAPRHRAVFGQAADADVAAGGVLHGDRQPAQRIPADFLLCISEHAVALIGTC